MAYSYGDPQSFEVMPNSVIEQMTSRIRFYSTALFKLWLDDHGHRQGNHIGSGTFVTIRNAHGILTAQHVTECLQNYSLGLCAAREGEEHVISVERSSSPIIEVAKPDQEEFGPDLAFILLTEWNNIATIKASKLFYPLDDNVDEQLNEPPPLDAGIWFFCGAPGELMRDEVSERKSFHSTKIYQDLCIECFPSNTFQIGDYDYIEMSGENSTGIPTSFAGMSGGGLWQVTIAKSQEGETIPSRYLFSGVNFYQGIYPNGIRYMRCHGRRSVYEQVFRAMMQ